MVVVPFGFSIGDFIAGTRLLIDVLSAFKEASGVSSKYASEIAFLLSLTLTLQHLDNYVKPSPQNDLSSSISRLLDTFRGHLEDFNVFLERHEASLGKASTKSKLGKVPRTFTYTLNDISGKIEKFRRQAEQPLQAINSLLLLQQMKLIEELPDQPSRPEKCAQIVEAIKAADIPTELDKQIQVLQRSASEQNVRQDEHLQHVKELRAKLDSGLASLSLSLGEIRDATTTDIATKADQHAQLDASKNLQSGILQLLAALETRTKELTEFQKMQNDLIHVMKTFFEQKAEIQERAITEAKVSSSSSDKKVEPSAWPSATLTAANLAITLLSTIVSSVTAMSVIKQSNNSSEPKPMFSSEVPDNPRITGSTTSSSTRSQTEISSEPHQQSRALTLVSEVLSLVIYGSTLSFTHDTSIPKPVRNDPTINSRGYIGRVGQGGHSTTGLLDPTKVSPEIFELSLVLGISLEEAQEISLCKA